MRVDLNVKFNISKINTTEDLTPSLKWIPVMIT